MGVGGLIGVAVAAVAFLVTQEMTPLLVVVVPLAAVVSLVGAFAIVRYIGGERSVLAFLLGLVLSIPSAYRSFKWLMPSAEPHVAQIDLPGFSIRVQGNEFDRFATEYDFGWYRATDPVHEVGTAVFWREGTLAADADSPEHAVDWLRTFQFEAQFTGSNAERELDWPGLETRTFKVFSDLDRTDTTLIACGNRMIAVITTGRPRANAERAHRRTVSTIACSPVAEDEVGVGKPPPVKTTPPEGWEPLDLDVLWTAWGNGNATLLFQYFYRGHADTEDIKKMVTEGIGQWGTVEMQGSERVGEIELWRGTLTDDDGKQTVLAYKAICGPRPMLAVLFGWETVEEGRAALLAARCE